MTINQQAIEAVALVLVDVTGEPRVGRFERTVANAILEAAMPHIRKQIAERLRDAIEAGEEAGLDAYTDNEVAIWLHDRAQKLTEWS